MGGDKNLYELRHLSGDDCWSVFLKHAFMNNNINDYPELELIGRGIIKKCGGLPLAARALGGLLRNERKEREWNIILNNPMLDHKSNILPALRLSYKVLPSSLKICFGYCAIFPKDYEFDKEELIRLWMAEGFIQQSESDRQNVEMEDLGDTYFQELLSRSFFQPSSSNKSSFVMHDLVNDLAKCVASEICFSVEENLERNHQQIISAKFRHSSFPRGRLDVFKKFEVFHGMEKHLRTFVALPINVLRSDNYISNKIHEALIPKLKCLRVLSLSGYRIYEIPNSIGALKHLKYLNLSKTNLKCLPESIGNLYMLQTLILSSCYNLMSLPRSIQNLNSIRYLDVINTSLKEMPTHFGNLKSLQALLCTFTVGHNYSSIKELRNISNLGPHLGISELENAINAQDARAAFLDKKYKLENLRMGWSDSGNVGNQQEILDSLQPPWGLNKLTIEGYGGSEFPHWLEDVRFCKVVKVKLVGCKNCTFLPCLGQLPMLKDLAIEGMDAVKYVGKEFYGGSVPFPRLESLTFSEMPQCEEWESPSLSMSESYPRLLWLTIQGCPKLIKELPTYLPCLVSLHILRCPRLEPPLTRFPCLSQVYIYDCNEGVVRGGVDFHSLEKLEISKIVGLAQLQQGFLQFGLQDLTINYCDELRWLWEENGFDGIQKSQTSSCPGLEHQGSLSKLQSLRIEGCRNLEKLPDGLHRLTYLKELKIWGCPKLSSFPNSGFPPMLTWLDIWYCTGLEMVCFPEGQLPPTLQTLSIGACKNMEALAEGQYPSTLKELKISICEKLKSLPGGMMMQPHDSTSSDGGLHVLEIDDCPSLKCFPAGKFPSTLKKLTIRRCLQLEPISEKMFHSNNNSLEDLVVWGCPSLKIIPDCLYNLRTLQISDCENLKRLPRQLLQNLRGLGIYCCENFDLEAYELQGLTALTSLDIYECASLRMPLSQWGLANLPSLKDLRIGGIFPGIASFPHDAPSLPTTLTSLEIQHFENLKSLTSLSLQTLTSLQKLYIHMCPKLESFCPKEGLPDMLSELDINCCPLLSKRCSKPKGQDWAHISHIPYVATDFHDVVPP